MQEFKRYILYFIIFLGMIQVQAQNDRKTLENKRQALKKEIEDIRRFLDRTKKKELDLSMQVSVLDQKIFTRQALISNMKEEINQLNISLNKNKRELKLLETELKALKEDYAAMIYKSYKYKLNDNQLLFLLSSENFYQGYLRYQYLKQYTTYRKKQGEEIVDKTKILQEVNDSITAQKILKVNLMEDMNNEQSVMEQEKEKQQDLVKKYQKEKKSYQSQISTKQKEEQQLTAQIENLIKAAIKETTTNKSTKTFELAPEAMALAKDFESNQGKLPWPVDRGVITVRFGTQPDPLDPKLKIESSGIRIATEENASVKTIFKGKVLAIQKNPQNGVLSVLIQHGNYISVYANLGHVVVSKGQNVDTEETIGVVYTNPVDGKSILKFQIWKNVDKQNPALWITK